MDLSKYPVVATVTNGGGLSLTGGVLAFDNSTYLLKADNLDAVANPSIALQNLGGVPLVSGTQFNLAMLNGSGLLQDSGLNSSIVTFANSNNPSTNNFVSWASPQALGDSGYNSASFITTGNEWSLNVNSAGYITGSADSTVNGHKMGLDGFAYFQSDGGGVATLICAKLLINQADNASGAIFQANGTFCATGFQMFTRDGTGLSPQWYNPTGDDVRLYSGVDDIYVIRTDGVQFPVALSSAPSYAAGGIYYDTTLHKLRVGGVSGWETITSI